MAVILLFNYNHRVLLSVSSVLCAWYSHGILLYKSMIYVELIMNSEMKGFLVSSYIAMYQELIMERRVSNTIQGLYK